MNSRELAEKIYQEILDRKTSTTSILRGARTLGKLLNNRDFDWVNQELRGYETGQDPIPNYRNADAIESKIYSGLDSTLYKLNKDWLESTYWTKWLLIQPVSELEDLISDGYIIRTGKVIKTLGLKSYEQRPIEQLITVSGKEIKNVLDQIQDKVQEQITEILAKPNISGPPSIGIFLIYSEKFPDIKEDLGIITKFIETGQDHLIGARSCRSALDLLISNLVKKPIPKNYVFSDGVKVKNRSEKSKIKYYLEQKGETIFGNKTIILSLDKVFRESYDVSSKAVKNKVNIYEANYCVDQFLLFLSQLYRYTDLSPIKSS